MPLCSDRSIDISCAPGPQLQTRCSDSEVATLWRYINTFITIIIISGFAAVGPCWDRKTDQTPYRYIVWTHPHFYTDLRPALHQPSYSLLWKLEGEATYTPSCSTLPYNEEGWVSGQQLGLIKQSSYRNYKNRKWCLYYIMLFALQNILNFFSKTNFVICCRWMF